MTFKKPATILLSTLIVSTVLITNSLNIHAEPDYEAEAEARKSLQIQSNETANWPAGPAIGAESAIVMDANSGAILYAKNIHEQLYPASTTKILTCLLATEHAEMDEIVEYSKDAVFGIERDSSNMGMDVGEKITMEQSLYGILVGSANEAACAVAEHISGSVADFATLMNEKAASLGCKDSHFMNPNGLYNENHYTSAYDLATIASAFFQNELLCKMSSTPTYEIPITATQPDDIIVHSKNKLLKDRQFTYDSLVGSKTGFTSEARQTLVSCAKKNGMTLICVIMKEESPYQFSDTATLFDYGFDNFQKVDISENEVQYSIDSSDLFHADNDVLGNSKPVLALNQEAYLVLPKTAVFKDTLSSLSYTDTGENSVATIDYTYNDIPVGHVSVDLVTASTGELDLGSSNIKDVSTQDLNNTEDILFINITKVFLIIIGVAGLLIGIFVTHSLINNYQFSKKKSSHARRKKITRIPSEFDDYNF
ncbi:MAG: D-alanyl-D-alanine carboxypeptidase family protein [Lachnospiraceae bacterium]